MLVFVSFSVLSFSVSSLEWLVGVVIGRIRTLFASWFFEIKNEDEEFIAYFMRCVLLSR